MNEPGTTQTGPLGSTIHVLRADADTIVELAALDWNRQFRRVCLDPVRGVITLMSPSRLHEDLTSILDDIVRVAGSALAGAARKLRSPRLRGRGEPPGTGMEPDCAFYVGERARAYRDALREGVAAADAYLEDIAPDLVVEAEITSVDAGKAERYGEIGVRELWHLHGRRSTQELRVEFHALSAGSAPRALDASEILEGLTPDDVCEAVEGVRFSLTDEESREAVARVVRRRRRASACVRRRKRTRRIRTNQRRRTDAGRNPARPGPTRTMAERKIRPRRSFIFSPGLKPEMFPKALACGADIVCVELEDGIAPKDKAAARVAAMALFAEPQVDDGVERIVRINCVREAFGLADVQAVLASDTAPPALMLPKVRTPDEVVWLDDLLSERGHGTRLHVIIETNPGLEAAYEIAHCSDRLDALFFGGVDMAAELRCANAWEPLLYARSRVVHAAASAGLDVIDVPYLDLEDPEGMETAARQARNLGFSGKGAIHPKQIPALNAVFTPDAAQIERARRIIRTFEEADTGLVVIDGKLIEKPVLRDMHRILAIAERVRPTPT